MWLGTCEPGVPACGVRRSAPEGPSACGNSRVPLYSGSAFLLLAFDRSGLPEGAWLCRARSKLLHRFNSLSQHLGDLAPSSRKFAPARGQSVGE